MKEFLSQLRHSGELLVVEREVDPRHELAAVTKKAQMQGDQALLFERVSGSKLPVATNLYNSRRRLCELAGAPLDGFCRHWSQLVDGIGEGGEETTRAAQDPAPRRDGALSDLPLITYHGKDAGPYFTSAIYLARDPGSGVPNLSFHRSMYVADDELRIRLGSSHDLARYQRRAEEKGEALEVALLIGVEPAVFLAACTSIPPAWSELDLAARVAGRPIDMEPCAGLELEVPASTQIVVEGRILPHERRPEGPFGEFLGYYVPEGENHVFQVDRVRYPEDAVFHSLLCGSSEDLAPLEAVTAARVYRHLVNAGLPGILDVSCSPAFMNTTIRIRQQFEGHARQVMLAAFGANMDYNRAVFVVDEDIDITDMNEVMWAFLTRGRVDKRVMVLDDVPGFYRDPHKDYWGRIGVDATMPMDRREEFERKTVPGVDDIDLRDYLSGS
ncbi:UbiD family decarboxylase [Elongatibacter sediminis]|uniref:UbiD family decarboxylase n=1 Tax=Elongatibacter sediminis TaxID=3119006 RepID=A0AAW9RA25_9GAMM